ncbi:hypothetical protein RIF29_42470 [Crotalaria pallida]|uniref:NAC domain-containing protein n=1 Tax=Crotalaria pallida TaxID=3830 RepID=A0AAN9ECU8_CROPI
MMAGGNVNLPPGFYFSPTDEELVLHFLYSKVSLPSPCHHPNIIPDLLHVSLPDPWELNGKALSSGNQHYYFFTKENKENKVTENGYWNEIGMTEAIVTAVGKKVGTKKYLVFHLNPNGEAPHGSETGWVMQEYHHHQSGSKWVLCKVYERKSNNFDQSQRGENYYSDEDDSGTELSWEDQVFLSLDDDDLEEIISLPLPN